MFMLMLNYPLRVDLKKIKSGYSKFSMKIPNVQSPRLSRLGCSRQLSETVNFACMKICPMELLSFMIFCIALYYR